MKKPVYPGAGVFWSDANKIPWATTIESIGMNKTMDKRVFLVVYPGHCKYLYAVPRHKVGFLNCIQWCLKARNPRARVAAIGALRDMCRTKETLAKMVDGQWVCVESQAYDHSQR